MDSFDSYKDYKSILDANPTEEEWIRLFIDVKAYSHYTLSLKGKALKLLIPMAK